MYWLLPGLITGLEVLLLWRLIAWRAWRVYPIFFWYLVYVFVRTLLLMYLNIASPLSPMAYSLWFWCTGYLAVNLRFAVAWEIFKNYLPTARCRTAQPGPSWWSPWWAWPHTFTWKGHAA